MLYRKSAVFVKLLRHYDELFATNGPSLVNIACGDFASVIIIQFANFKVHESYIKNILRVKTTRNDQIGDKVVPYLLNWLYIILMSYISLFDILIFCYFIFIVSVMVYAYFLSPYLIKSAGFNKYQSFFLLAPVFLGLKIQII